MIRTVLISLVVLVVACVPAWADVPAGWPDPVTVTITGQGSPYDGIYALPWDENGGEFHSLTGTFEGTVDVSGDLTIGWIGQGAGDWVSAHSGDFGASWSVTGGEPTWVGVMTGNVPEGGMTASVGSLFNLVVSSALSALTPGVALIVGVGVTLFLVALLLVVVRGRLLHVAVAGRSPVASSSVRQGPSRRMLSSGRRGVGLGEKKRTRHV